MNVFIKKYTSTIVLISMLLFFIPTTAFAQNSTSFSDVNKFQFSYTAITYLQQENLVQGFPDNTFRPNQILNRAEFLKIVLDASGTDISFEETVSLPFTDVSPSDWFYRYVSYAYKTDIAKGYPDNTFRPADPVSKVEAMKMLTTLFNIGSPQTSNVMLDFSDIEQKVWYTPYIETFVQRNLDPFTRGTLFQPNKALTRSEMAELVFRVLVISNTNAVAYADNLIATTEPSITFVPKAVLPPETTVNTPISTNTTPTFESTGLSYVDTLEQQEQEAIKTADHMRKASVSIVAATDQRSLTEYLELIKATGTNDNSLVLASQRSPDLSAIAVYGSGFFVTSDGLIATNKHVIEDPSYYYSVITSDGTPYSINQRFLDPILDIGFIRLNKFDTRTVTVAPLSSFNDIAHVGQTVFTLGNPLGKYENTLTKGIISGNKRTLMAYGNGAGPVRLFDMLQMDAPISQGNSGGALFDASGTVIGINTALDSEGENLGFAMPSRYVLAALRGLQRYGYIPRPFVGVRYITLDEQVALEYKLASKKGAWITEGDQGEEAIEKGSPAEAAGLQSGDIILAINGEKITKERWLSDIIPLYRLQETLTLTVNREGKTVTVSVTPRILRE